MENLRLMWKIDEEFTRFVERLWRSVKDEKVYANDWQQVPEARAGLGEYFTFYNHERPHQPLGDKPPAEVYFGMS